MSQLSGDGIYLTERLMPESGNPELKAEEPASSASWASAIPELFYDVLARILPGFFVQALFFIGYATTRFWLVDGKIELTEFFRSVPPSVLIPSAFVWSWITGLLLTFPGGKLNAGKSRDKTIQHVFDNKENKKLFELAWRQRIISTHVVDERTTSGATQIYQDMHEFLKAKRIEWRSVLSKNQAEVTFYENVTASLILYSAAIIFVSLFFFFAYRTDPSFLPVLRDEKRRWIEFVGFFLTGFVPEFALFFAAAYSMRRKYERLWARHISILRVALGPWTLEDHG